jgi:hypothetical protein
MFPDHRRHHFSGIVLMLAGISDFFSKIRRTYRFPFENYKPILQPHSPRKPERSPGFIVVLQCLFYIAKSSARTRTKKKNSPLLLLQYR